MTSYLLRKGGAEKTKADAVVVGALRTDKGVRLAPGAEGVAKAFGRRLAPLLSSLDFTAAPGQVAKLPTAGRVAAPLLVLVGLGDRTGPGAVRAAAGCAARAATNAATVALALPTGDAGSIRAAVEGYALGGYTFTRYRSAAEPDQPGEVVVLTGAARTKAAKQALQTAEVVAAATVIARDWVNTPGADLTPARFAEQALDGTGKRSGRVTATVLDEDALAQQEFGGLVAVGRGSANPPRLLRLDYAPTDAARHLGLVGEGITFDSGGLSLKPSSKMPATKASMSGAAAVVAATRAIARLGLRVRVTAVVPLAENMVSGRATRPGDVLTMLDGTTVEVLDPGADGRIVVAEGLALAARSGPDLLVDVATLTGAIETALGDRIAGLFGNDDTLIAAVGRAATTAGEALWPMPIPDEMPVKVRGHSTVADLMQHNTDRWGEASYAAAFLAEFVGALPWAHLDIAGTAFNSRGSHDQVPGGGTGFGVATLVELARMLTRPEPLGTTRRPVS